ncbi:MAG TPA: hypothetical protein VKX46_21145 [Ktedonobacteraceae bacterium]|nr:hypothetical protein [Ktedonobacteraceae bacterium]
MNHMGKEFALTEQQLICPICTWTRFEQEQTLTSTLAAKPEEIDPKDAGAETYICTNCGYILWFVPEDIEQQGQSYTLLGQLLRCPLCKEAHFTMREIQLSTRGATFMKFDWANPSAATYTCTHCGYIQWLFAEEVGRQGQAYKVGGRPLTCQCCGRIHFRERETLMHSRAAEGIGATWSSPTARNYVCTACGFIHWFV